MMKKMKCTYEVPTVEITETDDVIVTSRLDGFDGEGDDYSQVQWPL